VKSPDGSFLEGSGSETTLARKRCDWALMNPACTRIWGFYHPYERAEQAREAFGDGVIVAKELAVRLKAAARDGRAA
jgi:hypothetical protein